MRIQKIRKILDYIPLICLIASAIYLLWARFDIQISLMARHVIGLILLPISTYLFFARHKLGVVSLGIIILLGLLGILSYSPAISTVILGKTWGESQIALLFFQPIFIIWATLNFILSGRYYVGILSKRYWTKSEINSDEPLKI